MPSTILKNRAGTVTLSVEVPVDRLTPHLHAAAVRIATKVRFEGFRPGKAPYELVLQRLGEGAMYDEATEDIVRTTFAEAIREHKLVTVGPPEITVEKLAPGNPVMYQATVALMPGVRKLEYASLKARRSAVTVADEDVEKTVTDIRKMRAKEAAVDRPAATGDRIELDFQLFVDQVPIDGGRAERYPVLLGDNHLVPGFEEHLLGMKAGEEKTFAVTFPKDNPNAMIAGKPVEVKAKVTQVLQVDLPELDDDFAKSLGAFADLAALRSQIRSNLTEERKEKAENEFELALLDEVSGRAEFDPIPDLMLRVESNRMLHELQDDIGRRGLQWNDYLQHMKKTEDELRNELQPAAEKRVKTALVLREVAEREEITVSEDELKVAVDERVETASARGILPADFKTDEFKDTVRGHLRNEKVVALLKERAKDETPAA